MLESKLPLGIKSFSEPRHRGVVYSDKRSCAYVLATRSWLQILTRACGMMRAHIWCSTLIYVSLIAAVTR